MSDRPPSKIEEEASILRPALVELQKPPQLIEKEYPELTFCLAWTFTRLAATFAATFSSVSRIVALWILSSALLLKASIIALFKVSARKLEEIANKSDETNARFLNT